jgi:hypothetical protein
MPPDRTRTLVMGGADYPGLEFLNVVEEPLKDYGSPRLFDPAWEIFCLLAIIGALVWLALWLLR